MDRESRTEKSRNRIEKRTAYITDDIEWHYYIASWKLTAGELLHHARMEWSVETMHWLLDVHFEEDHCRVEDKNVQQNLNMLQKEAINLIKKYKKRSASKRAISKILSDYLLDPSCICNVFEN